MHSKLKFIFGITYILLLSQCAPNQKNPTDDEFIMKYSNSDFSLGEGFFISYRGANENRDVYLLNDINNKRPVYVIFVDRTTNEILSVDSSKVRIGYISRDRINAIVDLAVMNHFFLFGVDNIGNVYINPFSSNNGFSYVRLNGIDTSRSIAVGLNTFAKHSNNWYVRK